MCSDQRCFHSTSWRQFLPFRETEDGDDGGNDVDVMMMMLSAKDDDIEWDVVDLFQLMMGRFDSTQ